jgi:hypothetical protein
MSIVFVKFEGRDSGLRAVFREYGKEIVLNAEDLKSRIENLKPYRLDTSTEQAVLAELLRREKL